jgi:peptidoglycan/LPS O-acetylase OafA/YrhL
VPARLLSLVLALVCWFVALLKFGVRSWDPHPTALGALAGWSFVLAGCTLFFLSLLGLPAKYVPRGLAYLGRISFGLYVFHSLILHLVFVPGSTRLTELLSLLRLPSQLRPALGTIIVLAATVLVAHLFLSILRAALPPPQEALHLRPSPRGLA